MLLMFLRNTIHTIKEISGSEYNNNIAVSIRDKFRNCQSLYQLEARFSAHQSNYAQQSTSYDDVLLVDRRVLEYINLLIVDWKAGRPMVVYINDDLPVENLAFPYILLLGSNGRSLCLSELVRTRMLSCDNIMMIG